MNILMIYPKYPDTYWSFKHALKFISKTAAVSPLGLITMSAMLPGSWSKRLVDLNVSALQPKDYTWADYVFLSGMYVQKASLDMIIQECVERKIKMVAGGPYFTQEYKNYPQVDHFILNEAEITLPPFLRDLDSGIKPQHVYKTEGYADMSSTPVPDYHLLKRKEYAYMSIQVSRGCPFACDFCEITSLLGHKVRMKETHQVIEEMERLYALGWRGSVSIVDDNFIGNKKKIKSHLLPAMKEWMQAHKYPFTFTTQVSINLADDEELLTLMVESGFDSAFIGIETPAEESLHQCNKVQNENRDLLGSVRKIQRAGVTVSAGFIVGFDSDKPNIFQRQIEFIQQSGIVTAMVGLLNAPKNTKLYHRLNRENRLTTDPTGSNTDFTMNFIPTMNREELLAGYEKIITNIYSIKPYYQRVRMFLKTFNKTEFKQDQIGFTRLMALLKTIIIIGIINKGRTEFWKLFFWTLFYRPGLFSVSMTQIVYGYHFRTVFGLNKHPVRSRNS